MGLFSRKKKQEQTQLHPLTKTTIDLAKEFIEESRKKRISFHDEMVPYSFTCHTASGVFTVELAAYVGPYSEYCSFMPRSIAQNFISNGFAEMNFAEMNKDGCSDKNTIYRVDKVEFKRKDTDKEKREADRQAVLGAKTDETTGLHSQEGR